MRVPPFCSEPRVAGASPALNCLFQNVVIAAALFCAAQPAARAQRENLPQPIKRYSVEGRVSLPDDRPATRVRVKLSNQADITRESVTNDNGRYEFTDLPPGNYILSAGSLTDSSLVSDAVEADTNRTAIGVLTVNLFLRATGAATGQASEPGVVSVAEVGQKVPKEARKAFQQGLKLKNEERLDDAQANITRAVELYPEYFQALAVRGDIYIAQRKLAAAADDFTRALKANPRYGPALRGAGYCKLESKEFAEAAQFLARAAAVDPRNASTHLLSGIANLELDRRDAARQALEQALRIDATRAVRAHIYLANLFARERQYRKAADELRLYLAAVPSDPDAAELRKVEARWRAQPEVQ